jgi:hypothetical protein
MATLICLHVPRKRREVYVRPSADITRSNISTRQQVVRWCLRPRLIAFKGGRA